MRLPRFRLRTLMIVVAVVGLFAGTTTLLQRRVMHYRRLANDHLFLSLKSRQLSRATYHWGLSEKYRYAARHPWLPVEPDPPQTK